MLLTPCPTRTDFSLCGRAGLLSPVHSVVFLLYRPHRHRVSVALLRTHAPRSLPLLLSLVPCPLACLPSGSPVAPPVSAGLCFSPTAIWDLKCLPAFLRSLEHLLHPYHRQNFFAVHSLASLDSTTHLTNTWSVGLFTARLLPDDTLFYSAHPSLNANRLERHLTPSD